MGNVVACFKWVADSRDITIGQDLSVDMSRAKGKISEYDRNVLQAAAEIAAHSGGKAFGLTFGDESLKPALKDVLSRGIDEIYYVSDETQKGADAAATAKVLAQAIRTMPDVAVVCCAEGSEDLYARQVGARVAANLDFPVVSSVCHFEQQDDGAILATRKMDEAYQKVSVKTPVVLVLLPEAAEAPIPGLRAVMAAGKKPQHQMMLEGLALSDGDVARKAEIVDEKGYLMQRKRIRFTEGDDDAKADALLAALIEEGVL